MRMSDEEIDRYLEELLDTALSAEPEGSLPGDFAARIVTEAFPRRARRFGIEEILSPVLGIAVVGYAATWILRHPSAVSGIPIREEILRLPALPLVVGIVGAFALIWIADKRLMPEKLRAKALQM
jgi:hypothetical protein